MFLLRASSGTVKSKHVTMLLHKPSNISFKKMALILSSINQKKVLSLLLQTIAVIKVQRQEMRLF